MLVLPGVVGILTRSTAATRARMRQRMAEARERGIARDAANIEKLFSDFCAKVGRV